VVLRTLTLGHPFSQGTADSNEIWVETKVSAGDKRLGCSGGLGPYNEVDPWSHFVNVFMLDKDGNRSIAEIPRTYLPRSTTTRFLREPGRSCIMNWLSLQNSTSR